MASTITVRNLDEQTQRVLRHRAVDHDRSFEAEIRAILDEAAREDTHEEETADTSTAIILEAARKFREEAKKVGGFTMPERIVDYPRELFS